jgi:hypothetical protein
MLLCETTMTRWEALIRYDDEIRAAAEALFPYGTASVDKLGEAFFALNEDRRYLPNIVAQLTKEAEHRVVVGWLTMSPRRPMVRKPQKKQWPSY